MTREAKIWTCKIGEVPSAALPDGADAPMRDAVARAYAAVTGEEPLFIFSGWGGALDESERAVVERREPSEEYRQQWLRREAADDLYHALKAFHERGYTQAVGEIIKRALSKAEGASQ